MKQILIDRYGPPEEVARCAEVPDVGAPAAGEVVFDVLLFPINPADVSFCRGTYRLKPPLPATPGAECVGRVTAVGAGVSDVKPGDLVINLQRENWAQQRRVKADDVVAVPSGIDRRQAAMLRINPPTALLLLTDVVGLESGDWVIQNVANSAVGRLVIRLARARGRSDSRDLRGPRRADREGHPLGAGRGGVPHRRDQGRAGPRAARGAQRQDPRRIERGGVSRRDTTWPTSRCGSTASAGRSRSSRTRLSSIYCATISS